MYKNTVKIEIDGLIQSQRKRRTEKIKSEKFTRSKSRGRRNEQRTTTTRKRRNSPDLRVEGGEMNREQQQEKGEIQQLHK